MNGGGDTKWYVLWIAYCFLFYLFTFKKCRLSKFCFFFLSIITFNLCHVRYRLSIKHFHGHLLTTRSIENWKERIENWHAKPTNYFFIKDKFLNFFLFLYFFNKRKFQFNEFQWNSVIWYVKGDAMNLTVI